MTSACDRFLFCFSLFGILLCCGLSVNIYAQGYSEPPHNLNVICYISTWANYRDPPANFFPEDIDPEHCTHLIYSFVGLDNKTNKVISLDPWADLDPPDGRGFFRQMTGLKVEHPHIKVLLAVGGFTEGSEKYSIMASSRETRAIFIASALEMVLEYEFDGFDLDWEYPGKRGGSPDDKENFVLLTKELREAMDPHRLILSSAFGAGIQTMDVAYDFPGLGRYLHMLNIMAYDYHGAFDNITGANSPFYPQEDSWGVMDTLAYMIEKGAPMEKVNLGLPLYGQTFIMDEVLEEGNFTLGVPCNTTGFPGMYTKADGFIGDQELCLMLKDPDWTRFWDNDTGTPFLLNQELLVSYDDDQSLALKIEHAIELGLGGLMVWSMDTDDFRGDCYDVDFAMMRFINNHIHDLTSTTVDPTATTTVATTTTDSSIGWTKPPHPLPMVCYISTWAIYRTGIPKYAVENIDPRLCTHLVYAFAGIDNTTYIVKSLDPGLDLDASEGGKDDNYRKMTALKKAHPHLKVLLAVGGASEESGKYSAMVVSAAKRRIFMYSILDFLKKYDFDGLDLDWEYPAMNGGEPEDKENFVILVKELREEFNKYGLLLTSAFGASVKTIDVAYDIAGLTPHLDMFLIMSYDYHGAWDNMTGSNAPLGYQEDQYSVMDTLAHLKELGAPMEKVVLGLPLYGHTFILLDPTGENSTLLGAPAENQGFPGTFIAQNGFLGYQEICKNLEDPLWTQYWDNATSTPYIINDEKVVSYDDERSLTMKVDYAVRYGVGGMMVWSMDTDDFNGNFSITKHPLMKRINNAVKETLEDMEGTTSTGEETPTTEDPGISTTNGPPTTSGPSTTTEPGWPEPPHNYNIVCYVKTWGYYRYRPANFTISDIDPTLCTHLVYMFAGLDDKTAKIKSLDPALDLNVNEKGKGYFMRMTGLRENNDHLKVLLAVGGESEPSAVYSDMASNSTKRQAFVDSVIIMLLKYEFDGLDLNWQYPGMDGGKAQDKANFVLLVQDLKTKLDRYGFILSVAIHGFPSVMDLAYDFPTLHPQVHMFNLMSFDYNMPGGEVTGANAPLHAVVNGSYALEDTLDYLKDKGVPLWKVNMGVPFYGHTFIADDLEPSSPWEVPSNTSFTGVYIIADGFLAYNEICIEQWDSYWDNSTGTPYNVKKNKLISYDDQQSIALKVGMGMNYRVGGFMIWSIDTDDFQGDCGPRRYPLLKTITESILREIPSVATSTSTSTTTTTTRATTTTTSRTTSTSSGGSTSTTTRATTTTPSGSQRATLSIVSVWIVGTLFLFL